MVAYQPGKAAKITAPATISHTSLPSHTGPIVLTMHAALQVVAPDERVQHADPEVESLQDEEADPEDGDDDEPEVAEIESSHVDLLVDEGQVVLVLVGRVELGVGD